MKKLLLLSCFVLIMYNESSARARIPVCTDCQYLIPVADLPDSAQFYAEEYKAYVDIAYVHKQFWVLWVPLWNFDEQYCLSIKGQDVYFDLSEEDLESYKKAYGLDLPSNPISFWDKFGGKGIVLILIAGIIWAYTGKDKSSATETKKEEFFSK